MQTQGVVRGERENLFMYLFYFNVGHFSFLVGSQERNLFQTGGFLGQERDREGGTATFLKGGSEKGKG